MSSSWLEEFSLSHDELLDHENPSKHRTVYSGATHLLSSPLARARDLKCGLRSDHVQCCAGESPYLIVAVRQEEEVQVLLLVLLFELIDQISSSRRVRIKAGPCTAVGETPSNCVSNSGVLKKGSPGGEGRLAVSVGENDSGGDLDGDHEKSVEHIILSKVEHPFGNAIFCFSPLRLEF